MKYLFILLFISFSSVMFGQSLAGVSDEVYIIDSSHKNDSLHSSSILSVSYDSDTLYVTARYYAVCCEKFVNYIDKKENLSQINFVVKSLEKGCICEVEKIIHHKVYAKDLNHDVKLKLNGKKPTFGMVSFSNPHGELVKKKKRKKDKIKEM